MALRTLYNPGALIAYQTSFSTFRLTDRHLLGGRFVFFFTISSSLSASLIHRQIGSDNRERIS